MIKFGTGGWRALIGEEFTRDNVQLLARGIARLMEEAGCSRQGFVVGYDRRFLSDKAARWLAEVIAASGIKVYFIERIAPTPMIMFAVNQLGSHYGAAVTASHNPADYNGIKIFTRGGRDAAEDVTGRLEEITAGIADIGSLDTRQIKFKDGIEEGLIEVIDPFNDYIDTILTMIDTESIKNSKMKILLDPMFGVSRTSLQAILITARCEVDTINDRHDTLFGGRLPNPNTHNLNHLKDKVVQEGYDIGIGTDGDADRLGIIDEKGRFIHPNDILSLLYYYLLQYKGWQGGVVRNVATTHLLDEIARGYGEECYEVSVGFKYISSMMEAKQALIGGESSGGLTIRGHIKGKDGIFAASLLIELLSVTGKSLSVLMEEIHRRFGYFQMVEEDLQFNGHDKNNLARKLFIDRELPDFGYRIKELSYRDGVKAYFQDGGWLIARLSGTEPLLRIFAERENRREAEELVTRMKTFLQL